MKRVNKICSILIVIFFLVFFVSCDKKNNYNALTTPNVKVGINNNIFYWDVVSDAEGYVISIDGDVKGIGNPIVEKEENIISSNGEVITTSNKYCEYILDVDSLEEGIHEVKFASYASTKLSAWSTIFEVSTATKILNPPSLEIDGNDFLIYSNYTSFEFNFGEGIVATYTGEQAAQGVIRVNVSQLNFLIVESGEDEPVTPTLESGKTYFVSVKAKTFALESKYSNVVEFLYEEQEKLPTPIITGNHEIDVYNNFTSNDYIDVYNNAGTLNLRINDQQFNSINYNTSDNKLDLVTLVLSYLESSNSVEKLNIQKEILNGKLEISVQLCAFGNYLNSEWSDVVTYSFINVEEYVQSNVLVTVRNYEVEISLLDEFILNYEVRLNDSLITSTLDDDVMKYNFMSKLNLDKEVNIVNITISGNVFGKYINYEIEPYKIIVSDINDLFDDIIQNQVEVSQDNLSILIDSKDSSDYIFEYSVLLNANELTGYRIPDSNFTGLKYDFINSGVLVIGENDVVVIASVKYNNEVVYETECLNFTFTITDPNEILSNAFQQTINGNQAKQIIADEYYQYMQNVVVNFNLNNLSIACEKISNTEYVYDFNEVLELEFGENTFNFTISGTYQGFDFNIELDKIIKEVEDADIYNFVDSLFYINFDVENNLIKFEEFGDYQADVTFNHYINGVNKPLTIGNEGEVVVPVSFGENKIIIEATIYCYGEERTFELLNKVFYIQEYVSDVQLTGSILSWDYNSKNYVNDELYQIDIYDLYTGNLLYSNLTSDPSLPVTNSIILITKQ